MEVWLQPDDGDGYKWVEVGYNVRGQRNKREQKAAPNHTYEASQLTHIFGPVKGNTFSHLQLGT